MTATSLSADHPLNKFRDGCIVGQGLSAHPIPLTGTRISVSIAGGLAVVRTSRTFRNTERQSIEATITFPIPVDATLTGLQARIGERVLTGVAQAKDAARADYERAIDEGRTAVLHEEALPGINVLSVAHLPPGNEITIESRYAQALSFVTGMPQLRIPVTVGQIYGASPLIDSDDLVHGPVIHEAELDVTCEDGTPKIEGAPIDGRGRVRLDRPIDINIDGWSTRKLTGTAAGGGEVSVLVQPAPVLDQPLNVEVLIDRSGSMDTKAANDSGTAFEVLRDGLRSALARLRPEDKVRLWEFDDQLNLVGEGSGPETSRLADRLTRPGGGTEIGSALAKVARQAAGRDILVATDGKSYALDVQTLARTGCRFSVLLIGEDSLDANIGYLASLTGGQIFVAPASRTDSVLAAALDAVRAPHRPVEPLASEPTYLEKQRAGALIRVEWNAKEDRGAVDDVGAFAAGLALSHLPDRLAALWAERHGIVSHLTSLILVDDQGEQQNGLPVTRKVPLMAPQVSASMSMPPIAMELPNPFPDPFPGSWGRRLRRVVHLDQIDWDAHADALQRGDLTGVHRFVVDLISGMASETAVTSLAQRVGIPAPMLVIALIALAAGSRNRAANRVFRAIVPEVSRPIVHRLADELGLADLISSPPSSRLSRPGLAHEQTG